VKPQSSGWPSLTLPAAIYSITNELQSATGQLEAAAITSSRCSQSVGIANSSYACLVSLLLRNTQAATICSSADLLWMIREEPFSSTMSFFLNSASVRVMVSRLVPIS